MIKNYLIGLAVFAVLFFGIFFFYKQTEGDPALISTSATHSTSLDKTFTISDVATHKTASDCWTIIKGKVYNITAFIPLHPGGSVIVQICGKDGSRLFSRVPIHESQNAEGTLSAYYIGDVL